MNRIERKSRYFQYAYHIVYYSGIPLAIAMAYTYNLWWWLLAGIVYAKILAVFGVQIGLHRYFAHRTFTTTKIKHIFLCWSSLLCGEGSPLTWATLHLHHHKNSDTEKDIHSPHIDGFVHATLTWAMEKEPWWTSRNITHIPIGLLKDKHVKVVHNHWHKIWALLIIGTLLISWKVCLFLLIFPACFTTINSSVMTNGLAHLMLPGSYRNFETNDKSTNNKWVQFYQIGEGLHNNHHRYPGNYNQAAVPGEFDPVAWLVEKFFIETDPKSKYKL